MLDDLAGLDRHLVREIRHADRFRHVDIARDEFSGSGFAAIGLLRLRAARRFLTGLVAFAARTPAVAARCSRTIALFGRLFARGIIRPGRGNLAGLDDLLANRIGRLLFRAFGGSGLVQRTRQRAGLGFDLRNLTRTIKHIPQGGGFSLCDTTCFVSLTLTDGRRGRRRGRGRHRPAAHRFAGANRWCFGGSDNCRRRGRRRSKRLRRGCI